MIGSLDRSLELSIAAFIAAQLSDIQCLPNLLGEGEFEALLPRVVVKSESREDEDFADTPDGIYGVCACAVAIASIAEATNSSSSAQMEDMNSSIDDVLDDPSLHESLSAGNLKVYGVVPGDYEYEISGNQIIRRRMADIWARLQ